MWVCGVSPSHPAPARSRAAAKAEAKGTPNNQRPVARSEYYLSRCEGGAQGGAQQRPTPGHSHPCRRRPRAQSMSHILCTGRARCRRRRCQTRSQSRTAGHKRGGGGRTAGWAAWDERGCLATNRPCGAALHWAACSPPQPRHKALRALQHEHSPRRSAPRSARCPAGSACRRRRCPGRRRSRWPCTAGAGGVWV